MDALLRAVAARCADLGVPPPRTGMVVGIDRDPGAKVTVLLFDGEGRPTAVAKMTRRSHTDAPLRAEHDMLAALTARGLPTVGRQVPRALLLEGVAGRTVLVTSALPGGPMSVRYHAPGHLRRPALVADDLAAAAGWLAAFQQDTGQGAMDTAEAFRVFALPAFDGYRSALGWGHPEQRLLESCAEGAERLAGRALPLCAVHGDFAPGNVLVEDAGGPRRSPIVGVVDWELGRTRGTALTDLFKFVASYGSFLDRAVASGRSGPRGHPGWDDVRRRLPAQDPWANLVGFLYAFTGQGWFPDLVREHLAAGYRRLGVPADVEDVFLPAFVAEQATTLADPVYRQGYRDLLHALAARTTSRPARLAGGLR